jgi:hypothetical protein
MEQAATYFQVAKLEHKKNIKLNTGTGRNTLM